jgi:hypothetical protein
MVTAIVVAIIMRATHTTTLTAVKVTTLCTVIILVETGPDKVIPLISHIIRRAKTTTFMIQVMIRSYRHIVNVGVSNQLMRNQTMTTAIVVNGVVDVRVVAWAISLNVAM